MSSVVMYSKMQVKAAVYYPVTDMQHTFIDSYICDSQSRGFWHVFFYESTDVEYQLVCFPSKDKK